MNNMTTYNEKYGFKSDSELLAEYRFKQLFSDISEKEQSRLKIIFSKIENTVDKLQYYSSQ